MPQNPLTVINVGSTQSTLNITAAVVVKASPGRVAKIIVEVAPSAGNLIINDNTQTGGTNVAANQIYEAAFGSLTEGQVITLDWPCANGIVISSVGTGGVYSVSFV